MRRGAILLVLFCLFLLGFIGCTRAKWASIKSYGSKHRVQLYSGGKKIGEWISSGVVVNEEHSDGFHFEDEATGMNVEISGTVIIMQVQTFPID